MAKLVFGMNQSLDGYVDHTAFAPGAVLFQHFIGEAQAQRVVDREDLPADEENDRRQHIGIGFQEIDD